MPVTRTIASARRFACVAAAALLACAEAQAAAAVPGTPGHSAAAPRRTNGEALAVETIDVSTMDRQGTIRVDGRVLAEGDYRGRLPVGTHVIVITRPGYDPFEKTIVLRAGQPYVELISLTPSVVIQPPSAPSEGMRGAFGSFAVGVALEPGGLHSNICSVPGVTQCSTSAPLGAGLLGSVGYMADPIGVDALIGLQFDAASVKASAAGQTASATIPSLGGLFAARARLAWQNAQARFTMAAGIGAAIRSIGLGADGLNAKYAAPAITIEGAIHLRFAKTAAFAFGLLFWGENAGRGEEFSIKQLMVSVVVVRSTQAFFLPFIGIEMGP